MGKEGLNNPIRRQSLKEQIKKENKKHDPTIYAVYKRTNLDLKKKKKNRLNVKKSERYILCKC